MADIVVLGLSREYLFVKSIRFRLGCPWDRGPDVLWGPWWKVSKLFKKFLKKILSAGSIDLKSVFFKTIFTEAHP